MKNNKDGFSLIEILIVLGVIAAMSIGGFFLFSKVSAKKNIDTAVNNLSLIQSELEAKQYSNYAQYSVNEDKISFHYDIKKNKLIKIADENQRGSNVYQIIANTSDGSYDIFMISEVGKDPEMEQICANFGYSQYRKKEFKQLSTMSFNVSGSDLDNKLTMSDFLNACSNDIMPILSISY